MASRTFGKRSVKDLITGGRTKRAWVWVVAMDSTLLASLENSTPTRLMFSASRNMRSAKLAMTCLGLVCLVWCLFLCWLFCFLCFCLCCCFCLFFFGCVVWCVFAVVV